VHLLDLPDGTIFVSGYKDGSIWFYGPASSPNDAWRPTIASVSPKVFGQYWLNGTQLNGLTNGADFGDDGKFATNFPVVTLVDSLGHVTFARSHNFSRLAPTPGAAGYVQFAVPSGLANGTYTVRVTANGVSSTTSSTVTVGGRDMGIASLAAQVLL
jgi:hypothetical protein